MVILYRGFLNQAQAGTIELFHLHGYQFKSAILLKGLMRESIVESVKAFISPNFIKHSILNTMVNFYTKKGIAYINAHLHLLRNE